MLIDADCVADEGGRGQEGRERDGARQEGRESERDEVTKSGN